MAFVHDHDVGQILTRLYNSVTVSMMFLWHNIQSCLLGLFYLFVQACHLTPEFPLFNGEMHESTPRFIIYFFVYIVHLPIK